MKKILIILSILLFGITVKASINDSEVKVINIPNVYYNYLKDGLIYWGQMGYIYANGTIAYCYNIEDSINTNTYSSDVNLIISDEIKLIAYFGYNYELNNTLNDYIATQELIWEYLGKNTYYTTESEGKGTRIDVNEFKNKIKNSIKEYNTLPNINALNELYLGTTNTINDKNKVLKKYNVIANNTNRVEIYDNNLIITPLKNGDYSFYFKRDYDNKFENKIYTSPNSQTIIQIGNIESKSSEIYSYKVVDATLKINLYDYITNTKENSGTTTFKGNIFELYDVAGKLMATYETKETGLIDVNNLGLGTYTLKHISVSEGYKLEITKYKFEVSISNPNKNIDIYLKPITTILNIKKTYGNPKVETIYNDANVIFDIINSKNEIISSIITNENGECNIELIYDEYKIIQKNKNIKEELHEYEISNNKFSNIHNYDIYTPIYDAKLKLYLYESGTTLPINNITFNINGKEYITNNEGLIITEILEHGKHEIVEDVKEGYYNIDNLLLVINENLNFYNENNDVYIDLIVYNEKIPIVYEPKEVQKIEIISKPKEEKIVDELTETDVLYELDEVDIENELKKIEIPSITGITEQGEETNVNEKEYIDKEKINFDKQIKMVENLEEIKELPKLGINHINYFYMIVFIFKIKNVKKNN